jgi:hypothetical protein
MSSEMTAKRERECGGVILKNLRLGAEDEWEGSSSQLYPCLTCLPSGCQSASE